MRKFEIMKKLYIFIVILGIFAIGLEVLNINLSDKLASDGLEVRKIQGNIDLIEEENQVLNIKVLEFTSFDTVSLKAKESGFVQAKNYITLNNQTKLSYKR